jgi:uncharacterized protein
MIKRKIQSDLSKFLKQFPVIGISGPRQCGKTTLVKELFKQQKEKYIYLDLELTSDINKLRDPEIFFTENISKCIIIDEVQIMPELFPLLRAIIDKKRRNGMYILLGSISPDVMIRQSSESLAGRIKFIELAPFNLLEIIDKYDLNRHWIRGGFPLSFLNSANKNAFHWLESFIATYIERDLGELGLNVNSTLMKKLWRIIAHYNGNILNSSEISRALGINNKTITRYLHFLEEAFIITLLPPFSTNVKKRLVRSPKIYIRDSGILHALNDITSFNSLLGNVVAGSSWEGYVIEQIKQILPPNYRMHYYRTQDGSEADLVITVGSKVFCTVEIKFSKSPELRKGNIIAIQDLKSKNNFVVGYNVDEYKYNKNIRVTGIENLLRNILK